MKDLFIRIDCDDWFFECPVRTIKGVARVSFARYEVFLDGRIFPHPEARYYVDWTVVSILIIEGVAISDEIMDEVSLIARLNAFLEKPTAG